MTCKILRLCASSPYKQLFNLLYTQKKLANRSYEEAVHEFQTNGFLVPGSFAKEMQMKGYEAKDCVVDLEVLQTHWVKEKGLSTKKFNSLDLNVLASQIEAFKPDVIFFQLGGLLTLDPHFRKNLKRHFPSIKMVTAQWGDVLPPLWNWSDLNDLDHVFCTYKEIQNRLHPCGISTSFLPYCFDEELAAKAPTQEDAIPFCFAGTTGYGFNDHTQRYRDLCKLAQTTDLQIWSSEPTFKYNRYKELCRSGILNVLLYFSEKRLTELHATWNGRGQHLISLALDLKKGRQIPNWKRLKPLRDLIPSRFQEAVFGIEYFSVLKSSTIVFNKHRDEAEEYANIRIFEATGSGSCLLTDRGQESKELFVPDEEIVTYSTIEEAIEKYHFLKNNEALRKKIAAKGKERTLRDHTLKKRCEQISETLCSGTARRSVREAL